MPDQSQTNIANDTATSEDTVPTTADASQDSNLMSEIAGKIMEAHNILIALSSDPSVDELATAIGLSITLDHAGKRATAIFSGKIPNALEFLKPEDTFETSADTLQDFVIAINKDKADHLRYKLDGDYVKSYITPYKTRIDEDDFDFSYGDYNIDLVLALDVPNGADLDSALREHGRIMHDATIVNLTTGNPGKFGEIEWSDKTSSSIAEMVARLLLSMNRKLSIESDDATALLTGIIAATNRFSNAKTTPAAMEIASELMKAGANQQLITENISSDIDNNYFSLNAAESSAKESPALDIDHADDAATSSVEETAEVEPTTETSTVGTAPAESPVSSEVELDALLNTAKDELQIPAAEPSIEQGNKYGQMLEAALAEANAASTPTVTEEQAAPGLADNLVSLAPTPDVNPATVAAPTVAATPEINGIPEMNFNATGEILPPPPAPTIDGDLPPTVTNTTAASEAVTPGIPTADALPPAPTTTPSANDGAFQIPVAS